MSGARFDVAPGDTVTAFALGPLEARAFHGPRMAMEDRVDYRFVNGWVDVGDLPCRQATWEEMRRRPVPDMPVLPDAPGAEVNLPGFSRRLEFSGFWHVPHRLVRAAQVRLTPPEAGDDHRFRVGTCGGVHIWVDGVHVAGFEPFTRNKMQETTLTLPLAAGGSDVVIRLEEMAERDTNFFLELTWLGQGVLTSEVPGRADAQALDMLMRLAAELRPERVCFAAADRLRLLFDTAPMQDVTLEAAVPRSVHLRHLPPLWRGQAVLRAGSRVADLGLPDLGDGYHPLELELRIGDTRLRRSIGFARLAQGAAELGGDLAARKAAALRHAAQHGAAHIGAVLARIGLGAAWTAADRAILDDTLDGIVSRRDCSDFVMVPLLWLLIEHAEALPPDQRAASRAAVLGYRYWMTEPGNDAMWFWSENHVLCFHVSQYLAGRLYPDAVFENSGMTGAEQATLGRERLMRWFDAVAQDGLAEWNSAAYYPIDFIGLLALAQLGEGAVQTRAHAALDRLFTMIALHTMGGTCAGSMGRAYDKELRAGPLTELSPFAAVAFGRGWLNAGVAALPMFCLGVYAPPDGLTALARPDAPIEARYVQGHGDQGRLALWKTAHAMLSACIDGSPGTQGHQQHLVDAQFDAPFARIWINHPGEDDPWGSARPSYWAGNGVMPRVAMHRNVALLLSDVGGGRLPFTHAYAPLSEFEAHARGADWLVLVAGQGGGRGEGQETGRETGRGAAILKASGPIEAVTTGPGAGLEWRVRGVRTGWALIICDLPQGGIEALAEQAAALTLTLQNTSAGTAEAATAEAGIGDSPAAPTAPQEEGADTLVLRLTGQGPELTLDFCKGLSVDGRPHPFATDARDPQITRHDLQETQCR